jgi:hypothetical protein
MPRSRRPASCEPKPSRILAVGDAIRTDLAAAAGLGIDALFIASGIHGAEISTDGAIDSTKLVALFASPDTQTAVGPLCQVKLFPMRHRDLPIHERHSKLMDGSRQHRPAPVQASAGMTARHMQLPGQSEKA